MGKESQSAVALSRQSAYVVEETLNAIYRQNPALKTKYGPLGKTRCREDINYHVCTLTESLIAGDPNIFLKYVEWGKIVLTSRKVRADDLLDCLLLMQEAIVKKLGKAAATSARQYLQMAIDKFELLPDSLSTFLDSRKPFGAAANSYLQALFSSDRHEARRVLLRLKTTGVSFAELCENIFEPVQREVGRLWQLHHISVAQEHYCTQSTEILMSEMRSEEEQGKRNGHLFVGACVAGEQHSIGMRMVSEMMEAHGWSVYCTGANTPTASLVDLVGRLKVQVLGISCASVLNLMAVRELTQAVRQASPRTKIAVGGRVFNESPGLWKKIGADIFAEKATSAPQAAARLLERKKAAARHA